jgi:hypothetical protein
MSESYCGLARNCLAIFVIALMMSVLACSSHSSAARASSSTGANHLDVMCMSDRIDNPSESFHYSFKYADSTNALEKQADISPEAMDITISDKSGTHRYHGTRGDEASWNSAVVDLSNLSITAMGARLDSLNGTTAIVKQGAEMANGYGSTKFTVDTANADFTDKQRYQTLIGPGSFEKGTVWIGDDGCAVKLLLDEGVSQAKGKVETRHYEMSRAKK